MITAERVRELAGVRSLGFVVTCYLDVDGARFPRRGDYEQQLASMARAARARAAQLPPADAKAVDDDIGRIVSWVNAGFDRSGVRGLACFASVREGLFEVLKLPVSPVNHVAIDRAPMVVPLELMVERSERVVVMLSDRSRARCYGFQFGLLTEQEELLDTLPRASEHQPRSESHQQRHVEEAAHRHLRRVAEMLLDQVKGDQGASIVLGGPAAVVAELERLLHPSVQQRVVGRSGLAVTATAAEVGDAAIAAELEVERRREVALVERLRAALGARDGAVAGLAPTLAALAERRVDTLVVSHGFEAPGWRCITCDSLRDLGPRCPSCDAAMELVDDVVGDAVGLALARSCDVALVRGNADLDVLGRVGALLRF